MHIQSIPMWKGAGNNYAYLVTDEKSNDAVLIDPAHPIEVLPVVKKKIDDGEINLVAIMNTHRHHDHAGGNKIISNEAWFKGKQIIGGKDCESVNFTPENGQIIKVGDISITTLYTPCHTQDSICWFMDDGQKKVVFTGDTLFHGGCGRFFEGTASEMDKALNQTLASLPDNTIVYPGHEYTKTNAKFAVSVLPSEDTKKLLAIAEANDETQGRFTIADEKRHNVYMRLNDPDIKKATGQTDAIEVMRKLRDMKDKF